MKGQKAITAGIKRSGVAAALTARWWGLPRGLGGAALVPLLLVAQFSLSGAFPAASQAAASANWGTGVAASLPADANSNPASMTSVSCASAGNCSAVGTYQDSSGHRQGLLLSESSGQWGTGVEASLPGNADSNPSVSVSSVSCASAGNCSAVGSYIDGSGRRQGLLLSESSGIWGTGVEVSLPADAHASFPNVSLGSVSCASAGNCSAVGQYNDSSNQQQGLLLTEASGTWGVGVEASLPSGATQVYQLSSVSCASAEDCSAVGSYFDSSFQRRGLLLSESGGAWGTGVEASLPADAGSNPSVSLGSVSCVSAGNCSAVGSYTDSSSNDQGLLLSESSGTWGTGVVAGLPGNAGFNPSVSLNSVSCASAGNCSAVGSYQDNSGTTQGLLLRESSGTWGTEEASLPADAGFNPSVQLSSVSCGSAGDCSAVGYYYDNSGNTQGLLLTESSGTWGAGVEASQPANANFSPAVQLASVSCASAASCSAVGYYTDNSNQQQGLLLSESSGTWGTGVEASQPVGVTNRASVGSVSCVSAGNCSAVGSYMDSSSNDQGLLLTESSGTWGTGVVAGLPGNAGSPAYPNLSSVSCASAGNCSAVGSYQDNSGTTQGLLLRESSGTWGTEEASLPADAGFNPNVQLSSVSCGSAGDCSAVGYYYDNSGNTQGLLLRESSGTWGAGVEASLPADADPISPNPRLDSVSCASAGNCSAVGQYNDSSGNRQGLLLSESGGTWQPGVKASLPADAGSNPSVSLSSVSCASAGNCSAIGSYQDSSGNTQGLLLSESGGTSTAVAASLPNANSNPNVHLSSVSCGSAGNCSAVGYYTDSSSNQQGLLLTESSGTWGTGVAASLPADANPSSPYDQLYSVSCVSAGNCSAVGYYEDSSGHRHGLLLGAQAASPSLSVSAPGSAALGSTIAPASLAGMLSGGASPVGTVSFKVFGPQSSPPSSCTSGGTTVGSANVSGNGTYHPSAGFTPASAGDYWWYASYGGDAGDDPAASTCGVGMAETVVTAAVPVNTALPTISGTVQQGQTLTETNGSWTNSPTAFAYQWQRCDSGGNNCAAISGATSQTYVLQAADVGNTVRVQETASNAAGAGIPAASATTGVVTAPSPGPPPITPPPPPSGAISSASATSSTPGGTASAANAGTSVTATGTGAFTLAQYGGNPAGHTTFASTGAFLDVHVAPGSSFTSLKITDCSLGGGTLLEWWNGSAWALVSPQSFSPGPPGCATTTLSGSSSPTIAQLTHTVFGVAAGNHFTVKHLKTHKNGMITLNVKVPRQGRIDVLVTAWNDNVAHGPQILNPAPKRFVVARAHSNPGKAKTVSIRVIPNARGKRLVRHHTYGVTLRLWVTYRPTGGLTAKVGFYGLHLP